MRDLIQKIDQLSQQLNESIITEKKKKPKPTSPEKWARAKAKARSKFDVYPSAYANAYASKEYKKMGGGWRMGESIETLAEAAPLIDKLGLGNFFRKVKDKDASSQKEIRILSGFNHAAQLYFKTILALNASVAPSAALFWPLFGKQALLFVGGALIYTFGKILATKIGRSLFGSTEEALAWAKAHLAAGKNRQTTFVFDGKTFPVTVIDPDSIMDLEQKISELEQVLKNREFRTKDAQWSKDLKTAEKNKKLQWQKQDQEALRENTEQLDELKCWPGYTRVKGVPAGKPGSCKKKTNEEELNELDWRKGLAAATMAAGALGAGNANAATWDKDSPEWSKSGLPDYVKTDTQFNKTGGVKSLNKQMSSVQGPNQYGEYKVTIVDRSSGQSKVTTYVTKNPPKELMMKEASNPAQQAAIAIAMKKAGKTPKKESAIMKGIQNEGK